MNKLRCKFTTRSLSQQQTFRPPSQRRFRCLVWLALVVASATLGAPSALAQCPVFQPKVYTLDTGKPVTISDSFSVPILRGTFKLIVENGDAGGQRRVSSGSILVNGVEVVRESDFSQQVGQIQKVIQLKAMNTLAVTLKGGSAKGTATPPFITVRIIRHSDDTEGPAINITQPPPGQITGSSPITVSGSLTDLSEITSVSVNGQVTPVTNGSFTSQVALSPGANSITVAAMDCEGNASTRTVSIVYDTLAPRISINSPKTGLLTRQPAVQVTGVASDDGAIAGVTVNGRPAELNGDGSYTANLQLAEGANTLSAVATDTTGKQGTASISVRLDTTVPIITLISPTTGQVLGATPATVSGTVADASGVSSLTVNGVSVPVINGAFSAQVPLNAGDNTINITATDGAGNAVSTATRVTLDTAPPQLRITSPVEGLLTKTPALTLTGTATDDVAVASVTVNGQPVVVTNDAFAFAVTLAEGSNSFNVVATDTVGKQTTAGLNVNLDTIPPSLRIVSPGAGQVVGSAPFTVSGEVTDVSGISGLTVNGVPAAIDNSTFSAQITLGGSAGNTINVVATDQAGNSSTASTQVLLDAAPPQLSIVSPSNGMLTKNQLLQVTGTATDDGAIASVTVNNQTALLNNGAFTASVALIEGSNAINVVATDTAGKRATASVNAILDTTPPQLSVASPLAGQKINGDTAHLTGEVTDLNGVAALSINGTATTLNGSHFEQDVPLQLGDNTIVLTATDTLGNARTVNLPLTRFATLQVSITSPAAQALFKQTTVTVTGTADALATSVDVNGVAATLAGGSFTAADVPLHEGGTLLTATAKNTTGSIGTASITVIRDTSPPIIHIDAPSDGALLTTSAVTVTGMVNDVVSGTVNSEQVTVTVNGLPANVSNRTFAVPDLLLVRGTNTVTAIVRDRAGNESQMQIHVNVQDTAGQQHLVMVAGNNQNGVIGTTLAQPLVVQMLDANGNALAGRAVTFRVRRSDGILRVPGQEGQDVTVSTNELGQASAQFQLGTRLGVGNNEVAVTAAGFTGELIFCQSSTVGSPTSIHGSMVMGESARGIVGQPLPMPFQVIVTDEGGNPVAGVPVLFAVDKGGGSVDGEQTVTRKTDTDGKASASFTLGPQVGVSNNVLKASFAGQSGEPVFYTASGTTSGVEADTRVSGVVLDNTNKPIPGATAKIVGTELSAVTDAEGQFTIHRVPVGTITMIVDGKTSPRPETFPFLAFQMMTIAGQENTVGMPIFMPPIDRASAKTVGGSEDVTLTMQGVPGVAFTVFAHSVTDTEGKPYVGPLSISQVHADKVPMPPPNGTAPKLVWTLQPAGLHFNKPIRVQLPNTDGLAPGQVVEIFSFDHALEQFVSGGMARVSADGSVIVSDPGFGVAVSGWGTPQPPPPKKKCVASCDDKNPCTKDSCRNGSCVHSPVADGTSCDDGDKCTVQTKCTGGSCGGGTKIKVSITSAPTVVCVNGTKPATATVDPSGRSIFWLSNSPHATIAGSSGGGDTANVQGVSKGDASIEARDAETNCSSDSRSVKVIDKDLFDGWSEKAFCAVGIGDPDIGFGCGFALSAGKRILQWEIDTFKPACRGEGSVGDAARHAYWSCRLYQNINPDVAAEILRRHENRPEDECVSHEQDLNNNEQGKRNAAANRDCEQAAIDDVRNGRLQVNNPPKPGVTCP